MRLKGKRVLVTAAGQGIGRASALAMAREGARVLATDVNAAALESLAAEGMETRVLNVRDPAAIAAAVAAAGRAGRAVQLRGLCRQRARSLTATRTNGRSAWI